MNYEGLPIKKYLTVGSMASTVHGVGASINAIDKPVQKVEIVCKREDIEVNIREGKNKDIVYLVFEDITVVCYLSDNFPSLQIFLDNFTSINFELCYLIEYGRLLFPNKEWYTALSTIDKFRKMVKITPSFIDVLVKYEQELLAQRKETKKKIIEVGSISKNIVQDIFSIGEWENFKQFGWLTKKEEIDLWKKLDVAGLVDVLLYITYLRALYLVICPEIFDRKKGGSPRAAFRHATMRLCTKDAPIEVRRMAIIYHKVINSGYNGQYVSQFIKQYKDYDSEYRLKAEGQVEIPAPIN